MYVHNTYIRESHACYGVVSEDDQKVSGTQDTHPLQQ